MTTALADVVTRRTSLLVDGREIEVSLVPGNETSVTPPAISFHLVGLHEKSDRTIPLPMLLRLAGYEVKLPKLAKGEARLNPTEEIKRLFEMPELARLERDVKAARGVEGFTCHCGKPRVAFEPFCTECAQNEAGSDLV